MTIASSIKYASTRTIAAERRNGGSGPFSLFCRLGAERAFAAVCTGVSFAVRIQRIATIHCSIYSVGFRYCSVFLVRSWNWCAAVWLSAVLSAKKWSNCVSRRDTTFFSVQKARCRVCVDEPLTLFTPRPMGTKARLTRFTKHRQINGLSVQFATQDDRSRRMPDINGKALFADRLSQRPF